MSYYKYRECFFKSPSPKPLRRENSSIHTSRTSLNFPDIRRFDAYGTPIKKGGRTHKVTFVDQVQKTNIAKVKIIKQDNPTKVNNKIIKNTFRVNNKKYSQTNLKCEGCSIF